MALLNLFGRKKKPAQPRRQAPSAPRSGVDCYGYPGSVEDYFAEVLARNFPGWEIRRNVSLPALGAAGAYSRYPALTFVFFRNGQPRLAVFLCAKRDYDRAESSRIMGELEQICKRQRIPFQRYFREFRNDEAYIRSRVEQALR